MSYESQSPVTEHAPSAERVFGEHEMVKLAVSDLVRLPQVRSGMNPDLPELKASINSHGLLNPIDVAYMSAQQFEAYIAFINRVWKATVQISDFEIQNNNGHYYVVIAGHTRAEAISQLQGEDPTGANYALMAKVHPISSPEGIINLQLDENIHTKPAQEQRAIAVVETYQYGLENNKWSSRADFIRQSEGKLSPAILKQAMGFAQLPSEARDFVFSKRLSYNAAVSLGLSTDTVMEYIQLRMEYHSGTSTAMDEQCERAYRQKIGLMIHHIQTTRLNGTTAKKYIEGEAGRMKAELERARSEQPQESLFTMASQGDEYMRQLNGDYRAALRAVARSPVEEAENLRKLHLQLVGPAGVELIDQEITHRRHYGEAALAQVAAFS